MSNQSTSGDEPSLSGKQQPGTYDVQLGGDFAVLLLVNSLNDNDPDVRKRAAFKLAGRGDPRAFDALVSLYHHGEPSLRPAVIKAFGTLRDSRAVDLLIERLEDENDRDGTRSAAVRSLGLIGDRRAVEPLIRQLEVWNPEELIGVIVYTLIKLSDRRAVPVLLHELTNLEHLDFDLPVRSEIVQFLQNTLQDELIPELLQLALGRDRGAALALGYIRCSDAVEPLLSLLREIDLEQEYLLAQTIVTALGYLSDPRAVEPLLELLTSNIYDRVIRALGRIGDKRAVEPLLELLASSQKLPKKGSYVSACISALGWLGDPRAFEPLAALVEHSNGFTRTDAATALGRLGMTEAIEPLLRALDWEDRTGLNARVIKALDAYYDSDDRVPAAIISQLRHNEHTYAPRLQAIQLVGQHRETRAVDVLIDLLREGPNAIVFSAAQKALKQIGTAEALFAVNTIKRTR